MLLRILVIAGSLAVFAAALWAAVHPANQWDFHTYYAAVKVQEAGKSPYDAEALREAGVSEPGPGYVYAPHTLYYFRGFSSLDPKAAAWAYLGAKSLLLAVLVALWRWSFLRDEFNVWFFPFVLLAFNGATCADLVSGNVQLFELTLLWLAFACYARGWDVPFGLLVVASASIRVWPALFLLMFVWRERWFFLPLFGAVFAGILIAVRTTHREAFAGFLRNAIALREEGWNNPNLWALLQSVRGYAARVLDYPLFPNWPAIVAYAVVALLVFLVTLGVGRNLRSTLQVYLACFAYVLVVPHLRPSGYMLLLVPAFHLLRNAPPLHAGVVLGLMAALPANPATGLPFFAPLGVIVNEYYLWLTAAVFWGLYVYFNWEAGENPPTEAPGAPGGGAPWPAR